MSEIFYRKWRPRTFGELAGQEHVATTLRNALAGGRIAHAYLFAGPRGTGKTSTGRLLGKALNCGDRQDGEPCNRCDSCLSFLAGRALDLIELDAASNRGIDEIRSLRDKVAFAPSGEYKVYLIDEVHMLTEAAFNALLKTLEEPPPHVVFVLATTETHKVPATIASRCQRFDFRRISLAASLKKLERICVEEGIGCEPAALELIARTATGSLRDAENLLDQLTTSYGSELTLEHVRTGLGLIGDERAGRLARMALTGDLAGGLALIASVRDDGLDLRQFQRELVDELRALLMVKSGLEPEDGVTAERRSELQTAVADVSTARVLTALRAFGEADLKADPNSTLPLDIALAECVLEGGQTGRPADSQGGGAQSRESRAGQSGPSTGSGQANRAIGQGERGSAARPDADDSAIRAQVEGKAAPTSRGSTGVSRDDVAPTDVSTDAPTPARPEPVLSRVEAALEGRAVEDAPDVTSDPERPEASVSIRPEAAVSVQVEDVEPVGENDVSSNGGSALDVPTLEAARGLMRNIYEAARKRSVPLGALVSACDIIEVNEADIVFGFRFANHLDKASEKRNREAFEAVILDVMARRLSVRFVHEPNIEDWMQRDRSSRSPLVRAAQEMGARVLPSEPEESP